MREIDEFVDVWNKDSIRVLTHIKNHWETYIQLVKRTHGKAGATSIIDVAKKGPALLYQHIIFVHIEEVYHHAGYEASKATAYWKLYPDNRILWSKKQYLDGCLLDVLGEPMSS